jgi:hypothetical protein
MDLEDFVSPEVGIAAAVVAAVTSPQVRRFVRRGAVLGVGGVLIAGDMVTSFARGVTHGAQAAASASPNTTGVSPVHAANVAEESTTSRGEGI